MAIPIMVCNDFLCPLFLLVINVIGYSSPLKRNPVYLKNPLKKMYEPIFTESESGSIEPRTNKNNAAINQVNPKKFIIEFNIGIRKDKEIIINAPKIIANTSAICSCCLPFIILKSQKNI